METPYDDRSKRLCGGVLRESVPNKQGAAGVGRVFALVQDISMCMYIHIYMCISIYR